MAQEQQNQTEQEEQPWFLKSSHPVTFPTHEAFTFSRERFDAFVKDELCSKDTAMGDAEVTAAPAAGQQDQEMSDTFTMVSVPPSSTTADIRQDLERTVLDDKADDDNNNNRQKDQADEDPTAATTSSPPLNMENKMYTENYDIANRSSKNPLVDLFYELEEVVSGPRLRELLIAAWNEDSLSTLKIIFNCRSIHLGKASRSAFYRCAGWLYQEHPRTFIANLQWLSRPVIDKKQAEKKKGKEEEEEKKIEADKDGKQAEVKAEEQLVMIDTADGVDVDINNQEEDEDDAARFDVRNGVSHGYWKDMLNMLVLAINDQLQVLGDPQSVLNVDNRKKHAVSSRSKEAAKQERQILHESRYQRAVDAFHNDAKYRVFHITVARLFAEQLRVDLALLHNDDASEMRKISMCAKWAPSLQIFHDKHTYIPSSIAELLHPAEEFESEAVTASRETYLRYARESYRKDLTSLRTHLDVVERHISANAFAEIKYERVPSLAMNQYTNVFATKDAEHFGAYLDKLASGKSTISGATMLPSVLIKTVLKNKYHSTPDPAKATSKQLLQSRIDQMRLKVASGQWDTLVQRIRDSGTLENCIAVCDVSGSMEGPIFRDGTCPMDSSIGLSLLVAEVTGPPFGGSFITFSSRPELQQVDTTGNSSLAQKVRNMENAHWDMSTDFEAVFSKLLLPRAIENKVPADKMVKRIFVFSDMQFNQAQSRYPKWASSFERVQKQYAEAGYEVPELVFWNLAGGRSGYTGNEGDPTAPKPVTTDDVGTALVSGYSQGMLKVFLDKGGFDAEDELGGADDDDDNKVELVEDDDGETVTVEHVAKKKQKIDPLSVVKKAIGHKAYAMLRVVD